MIEGAIAEKNSEPILIVWGEGKEGELCENFSALLEYFRKEKRGLIRQLICGTCLYLPEENNEKIQRKSVNYFRTEFLGEPDEKVEIFNDIRQRFPNLRYRCVKKSEFDLDRIVLRECFVSN